MATDAAGFRRVLHEWARRQLEAQSGHAGPFEIVHVELDHDYGSSMSSETTSVAIRFRHDGRSCDESWKIYYSSTGPIVRERCEIGVWSMPDTQRTVQMMNELLVIADEKP
jgi:hypothetical protein